MKYRTTIGARVGSQAPRVFRGTRERLRRLRMRGNGSWELWFLVVWILFLLLVVVPWMLRQVR